MGIVLGLGLAALGQVANTPHNARTQFNGDICLRCHGK